MAALPSEPPPGRTCGRRLFELLQERQEPFMLDAYLQEKGYPAALFPSQPRSMCWPINACKQTMPGCPGRGRGGGGGFGRRCWLLKRMLARLLSARVLRKALNWDKTAALHFEEEVPAKQLSPLSVLELHSGEASPAHTSKEEEEEEEESVLTPNSSPRKDLDILRELVELAYTSALDQFVKSKKEFDQDQYQIDEVHEERKNKTSWINQLTCSDIWNSRREWHEFQPQVREIGAQITEAIFEDMAEDVTLEILGLYCGF